MADQRYAGGWDPSYRNFEDSDTPAPGRSEGYWSLKSDFDEEISQLESDLRANLSEEVGHWESSSGLMIGEEVYAEGGYYKGSSPWTEEEERMYRSWVVDKPAIPNTEKRGKAKSRLLAIVQHSPKSLPRHLAARALTRNGYGDYKYSPTRIFIHEHPIATTIMGVAAAWAVFGLGYKLFQHLNR